jgi:hypothetical protein
MSDVIRVTCTNGHALKVKAKAAGTTLRCPQEGCGAEVAVPEVFPDLDVSVGRGSAASDATLAKGGSRGARGAPPPALEGRPLDPPPRVVSKSVLAGLGMGCLFLVLLFVIGGMLAALVWALQVKVGLLSGGMAVLLGILLVLCFAAVGLAIWIQFGIDGYRSAYRRHAFPKGMEDASAIPWLVGLTGHRHAFLRVAACERLERLGPSAGAAVPGLIQVSSWPHEGTRAAAAAALGAMGPAAASAVPRLRLMLNEPGSKSRASALAALAAIDPRSAETRAALEGAVDDRNADLQLAAIAALLDGGCDPTHLAPRLARHLEATRPERVRRAVTAVGRCGAASKPYIPQLRRLFKHPDKRVRLAARDAVSQIEVAFAGRTT